ncbi:cyclase family protein [Conexibacter sp. DBS9H8]|uniref:cyclase family protein n=1 Tax=Conexibacter sp. DBS9H8 TaxID=2937801 RepID=UPI00200BE1A4|nr:cyclase family protein [Conexibacter sp. DBS9H8]
MRIVDLSAPIEPSPPETPAFQRTLIDYVSHAEGAAEIEQLHGVPRQLLRDGEGWTRETLTLGTHNSTHVDAPWHYNSLIGGERAETIDELPLEWFFGAGVVLDFGDRADGEVIEAPDLVNRLAAIDHDLAPGEIVLIRTDRDAFYRDADYINRGPGVSAAATHWLYDRGIRVMGIDAWGWDRPLPLQAEEALREQRPGIYWQAHQTDLRYSQIERLFGLSQLPPDGFSVACFPLRVARASAAPARVVAILDD